MTGIGESLGINLLSEIIVKCVIVGYNVVQNSRLYAQEGDAFHLRLRAQIGIWQAIHQKFTDPQIQAGLRPRDIATFSDVMKQLHTLLRKYVIRKCQEGSEKTKLLNKTSAAVLFESLEEKDVLRALSDRERRESRKFWMRLMEEAAWTIWRKAKNDRFVIEIEFWGALLDRYASWTIPIMFPRASQEDIATHIVDPSGSLSATNLKGQIMMARSELIGAKTAEGLEQGPFLLDIRRIKFLDEKLQSRNLGPPIRTARNKQIERRKWGSIVAADGTLVQVIIEFKARPLATQLSKETDCVTNELDKLIRALRIAAQKGETFRVMYCEGWYESFDRFGLVYRLPQTKTKLRCENLANVLLKKEYRDRLQLDLENRIKVARALAWTLFELHSVNWVHKSFHPDNILFFGEELRSGVVQFDWSNPYVVGFDCSRSNTGISDPQNRGQLTTQTRLYTHPDRQLLEHERFQKIHDIYSLGVILLEVGRLRSFMEDGVSEENSPHTIKDDFVNKAQSLKLILGKGYREVVLACLNGLGVAGNDEALSDSFRHQVCERLNQIKVS